jgi:hypothetical protein
MDMLEEHYHPMNHRLEVDDMHREDSGMGDDTTVEVVERESEGVVLARHWTNELVGSGRSLRNRGVQKITPRLHVGTPVVRHGVDYWRVKKIVEIGWNVCGMTSKQGDKI